MAGSRQGSVEHAGARTTSPGLTRRWRLLHGALFAGALALAPYAVDAHVKWFADSRAHPMRTDLILSDRTALLAGAALVALILFWLAHRVLGDPLWPRFPFLDRMAIGAPTLLAVQTAISLIHSAVSPALFVPNLPLPLNPLGIAVAGVEIAIAFSFITGLLDWAGALVLLVMGLLAMLFFPVWDVLEQLLFAAIGLVILVIGRTAIRPEDARPWFKEHWPLAAPLALAALRILSGISVIALALGEKIWNPDLAAAFMAEYPHFNVFQTLQIANISNDQFVLMAGIVEGVIGVLLISGLLTRVVILFMWVPFQLGVPFLPSQELLGHLPIFAIMYLLLVQGPGIAPGQLFRSRH